MVMLIAAREHAYEAISTIDPSGAGVIRSPIVKTKVFVSFEFDDDRVLLANK